MHLLFIVLPIPTSIQNNIFYTPSKSVPAISTSLRCRGVLYIKINSPKWMSFRWRKNFISALLPCRDKWILSTSTPVLFWLLTKDMGARSGKLKENHVNIKRYPTTFLLQVHCFFTVLSRTQPLALISVTHIIFCKKGTKQTVKCKSTANNTYQWPPTQTF